MAFADKKGINLASPFKLQAEELLDVRQQVNSIAERNELVTLHAATAGLRVYVKADKCSYVYNGSGWDKIATSVYSIRLGMVIYMCLLQVHLIIIKFLLLDLQQEVLHGRLLRLL